MFMNIHQHNVVKHKMFWKIDERFYGKIVFMNCNEFSGTG